MDHPIEKYLFAAVVWLAIVTAIVFWMNRSRP